MTTSAVERLEELLELKDQQLQVSQERISELERDLEYSVDWMLHERIKAAEDKLPTPRIELRIVTNTDYYVESQANLVIKERGGLHSRIPLGFSKRSGSGLAVDAFPAEGELSNALINDLPSLLNDACFYSEQTGIPAYVLVDKERHYHITSLRPLKMQAV